MKGYISFLVFLGIASLAKAQVEKQLLPAELKQQTILTEPPTLNKGFFKIGASYIFTSIDKWFDENGKKVSTPGSIYSAERSIQLDLRYGITDRLTIHTSLPYIFSKTYNSVEGKYNIKDSSFVTKWSRNGVGLGDIDAGINYQLIKETSAYPSFTVKTWFTFPTGRKNPTNVKTDKIYDESTGKGEYSGEIVLQTHKVLYPFAYDLSVYYTIYSGCNKQLIPGNEEHYFKTGNSFMVSGSFGIQVNDWITLNDMMNFNYKSKDSYRDPLWAYNEFTMKGLDNYIYLYFQVKKLRLGQGASFSLWGRRYSADPGYYIFIDYVL